jgi:glycosyltransferase involved in cell wall biosynthesis
MKPHHPIAVEAFLLRHGHTGVERYIISLIRSLGGASTPQEYRVYLWGDCTVELGDLAPSVRIVKIPLHWRWMRILFQHFVLPLLIRDARWTLFTGYVGSLLHPAKRTVVCVYDLIALQQPFLTKRETAAYYRIAMPFFLGRARMIVCPTRQVAQDVRAYRPAGAVLTEPLPIDESFYAPYDPRLPPDRKLPEDFFLLVGYNEPRKNFAILPEIAARFPGELFVVVGRGTSKLTADSPARNIIALDYVDQDMLIHLYKRCKALLFPSLAEGFGYPVAEALACGKPVLCFKVAPLTEFAGPLVTFVDPQTPQAMQVAVRAFLDTRRAQGVAVEMERWPAYWARVERAIEEGVESLWVRDGGMPSLAVSATSIMRRAFSRRGAETQRRRGKTESSPNGVDSTNPSDHTHPNPSAPLRLCARPSSLVLPLQSVEVPIDKGSLTSVR